MLKFFKPPRDNGVVHIHNVLLNHPNEKLKIYYDLSNIHGYGNQNIYEACFIQDENDYLTNINEYSNIELVNYISKLNAYESETLTEENLKMCESIIKDNFILNDEMKQLFPKGVIGGKHRSSRKYKTKNKNKKNKTKRRKG